MPSIFNLRRREQDSGAAPISQSMMTLLIVLLSLILVALLLVAGLLYMRQRRRAQKDDTLPMYTEKHMSTLSINSSHRRTMARPAESVHVFQEKQALMEDTSSPPSSPGLPEIRVTFPEEKDEDGKRVSGRVVVVRVGDNNVGLEPLDDNLPAYVNEDEGRFQSLDLNRVGGLVEKDRDSAKKQ